MSLKGKALRDLVMERLVVAADEIFALFERTIAEYEEEVRSKILQEPRAALHHKEGDVQNLPEQEKEPPLRLVLPTPVTVKTEDDVDSPSFLQQEPPEENREDIIGEQCEEEEPGCSLYLQSDNEDQTYSYSDTDDSEGWELSAKRSIQSDGQGSKEGYVRDSGDGDIPALYRNLFFLDTNSNTVKKNTDTAVPKPYKCTVCGKAFQTEALLEKHVFIHSLQSPFRCPICNKPCTNKSSFKKHLNIHTEDKPFRCSVCKKGFNQKCNLKRHMQTHTEEKSFSCPECGLRLKQQHNMLRHISAVHRGEKPYSCPVCDKAFAQKTVFIIHMRTHTGEKPFSCAICKKRFRDKCHLKRHIKTHASQPAVMDQVHVFGRDFVPLVPVETDDINIKSDNIGEVLNRQIPGLKQDATWIKQWSIPQNEASTKEQE